MYPHIQRVPRYIVNQQKRKDAEQCANSKINTMRYIRRALAFSEI